MRAETLILELDDAIVKFMLKCDQPRGRKVADHPPKGPQTQSAPEVGRKTMTMMITTVMMVIMIMMIILIMIMVIAMRFLHPKGPQTGLAPGAKKL